VAKRSLIAKRVRAGLRNARAKGKRLGRPLPAGHGCRNQHTASPGSFDGCSGRAAWHLGCDCVPSRSCYFGL